MPGLIRVGVGSSANDGSGDTLRDAFVKINQAFAQLEQAGLFDPSALPTGPLEDADNFVVVSGGSCKRVSKFAVIPPAAGQFDKYTKSDTVYLPTSWSDVTLQYRDSGTIQLFDAATQWWTVPPGVTAVDFEARLQMNSGGTGYVRVIREDGTVVCSGTNNVFADAVASAYPVLEGQRFKLQAYTIAITERYAVSGTYMLMRIT